jgi:7-carboxy-7-deazaguanine synthase
VTYPLAPDGVYWTIQGEGTLTGTPMAFIRLAGCSVGCAECDTNYSLADTVDLPTLHQRVLEVTPASFRPQRFSAEDGPWVWITGGEPTDHDLLPLIDLLATTHRIALCTSGTHDSVRGCGPIIDHPGVRWVSVSPHQVLKGLHGHEVKLVPGLGALYWEDLNDIDWVRHFAHKWVQPLAGSREELQHAITWVQEHPGWKLSTQAHKTWAIK